MDPATGKELRQFRGNQTYSYGVLIGPDGKTLVAVSSQPSGDTTIRLWDVATGAEVRKWADAPRGVVARSPDGRIVAGMSGDNFLSAGKAGRNVRLWDVATG